MYLKKILKNSGIITLGLLGGLIILFACSCSPAKKAVKSPKKAKSAKAKEARPKKKKVVKPQVFFREGTEAKEGKVAPAILATTTKGKIISTTNNENTITILNFWSIRCGPCITEMPYLEDLYQEFKPKGLRIYSINTDKATVKTIEEFIKSRPFDITYDMVADPDLVLTTVFTEWFVPVTIIIDSKGVLRMKSTGFTKRDYRKYRKKIKGLLNEGKN